MPTNSSMLFQGYSHTLSVTQSCAGMTQVKGKSHLYKTSFYFYSRLKAALDVQGNLSSTVAWAHNRLIWHVPCLCTLRLYRTSVKGYAMLFSVLFLLLFDMHIHCIHKILKRSLILFAKRIIELCLEWIMVYLFLVLPLLMILFYLSSSTSCVNLYIWMVSAWRICMCVLEHATSLQTEDWGINMEICDIICETEDGCVSCHIYRFYYLLALDL